MRQEKTPFKEILIADVKTIWGVLFHRDEGTEEEAALRHEVDRFLICLGLIAATLVLIGYYIGKHTSCTF